MFSDNNTSLNAFTHSAGSPTSSSDDMSDTTTSVQRVKRPCNSFMLFRREFGQQVSRSNAHAHHAKISSSAAARWNAMTAAERHPYTVAAAEEKEEHRKLHPDYKFRPARRVRPRFSPVPTRASGSPAVTTSYHATIVPARPQPATPSPPPRAGERFAPMHIAILPAPPRMSDACRPLSAWTVHAGAHTSPSPPRVPSAGSERSSLSDAALCVPLAGEASPGPDARSAPASLPDFDAGWTYSALDGDFDTTSLGALSPATMQDMIAVVPPFASPACERVAAPAHGHAAQHNFSLLDDLCGANLLTLTDFQDTPLSTFDRDMFGYCDTLPPMPLDCLFNF